MYSKTAAPTMNADVLVPQRKIVEHEVHKPDGTVSLRRDVFKRDVNGDWVAQSFSTDAAPKQQP